jgi:ABC-2 type transport system permease protein
MIGDLFPNAWHVAKREYLIRVRSRTYVISTLFFMVLVAGVVLLPTVLDAAGVDDPPEIAVDVRAADLGEDPVQTLEGLFSATDAPGAEPGADAGSQARVTRADDPEAAADAVREGELDGLLTVSRADDGELTFEYLSDDSPGSRTLLLMEQAARSLAIGDRLSRSGLAPAEVGQLFAEPDFEAVAVDPDAATQQEDFGPAFLFAWALVIATFIAILTYGQWVAQSVAEEKSNRVMELLVTAATARQLLAGKVLGTGGAGLTQYLAAIAAAAVAWFGSGIVAQALGGTGTDLPLPTITPFMVLAFLGFFLGGFLLYSTLYAATGSMVSRIEEVQQASGPLMIVAMGGYFASAAGINVPDAAWVAWLSQVPFFSPYLMPARMLLTNVGAPEVIVSFAILAASVLVAILLAARIYSAGILLYGQRAGWRQVLGATRVAR